MADSKTFEKFQRQIKKGDLIGIRKLVSSGADVNIRNRFGSTPLMLAADKGHTPIIRFLLSVGADIRLVNDFGASALAYAALHGQYHTIKMLLDAGAPLNVRPHGRTLLEFAGWGDGRFRTLKHFELLREAGAI